MTTSLITSALAANHALMGSLSLTAWAADLEVRAEKVALFRQYVEGDHRANLTDEMRRSLRIVSKGSMNEFNVNHCAAIVETMANRLEVSRIGADNEAAQAWVNGVLRANKFDTLQGDIHDAALRDGDTYVLVGWDNEARQVRLYHEDAYDGVSGMIAFYSEPGRIGAAIKIWRSTTNNPSDTVRVNVYYPDRIEKYISRGLTGLERHVVEGEEWPAAWVDKRGQPLGVPVAHFRNRAVNYADHGLSEIENAIPIQDALNRTLYSMVYAGEMTAFQIRYAIGIQPPAGLTPGMWIKAYASDANGAAVEPDETQVKWFQSIRLGAIEHGQLAPFIEMKSDLMRDIYDITSTPMPGGGNDSASGESQKQREVRLLGKVRRFQLKAGQAYEDLMEIAARIQGAYGEQPPTYETLTTRWRSAELRDDKLVVENAVKVADRVGDREFLRMIASVYDWSDEQIEQILADKSAEQSARMANLTAGLPGFGTAGI